MQQLQLMINQYRKITILLCTLCLLCVSCSASDETFEIIETHRGGRTYNEYHLTLDNEGIIESLSGNQFERDGTPRPYYSDFSLFVVKNGMSYELEMTYQEGEVAKQIIHLTENSLKKSGWWARGFEITDFDENKIDTEKEVFYSGEHDTIKKTTDELRFESSYYVESPTIFSFKDGHNYIDTKTYIYDDAYVQKFQKVEYEKNQNGHLNAILYNVDNNAHSQYVYTEWDLGFLDIYNKSMQVNLLNFEILSMLSHDLPDVLFPLIFMEDPFSIESNWQYNASSYLTETNATYGAENLASLEGLPWASGNGYGIGDVITINMLVRPNEQIAFYNGFQSTDRPHLYEQNSRVKRIKITHKEAGNTMYYTLNDTPDKQVIDISPLLENLGVEATLEIEILEVYPGSKYTDLCIQAILPENMVE